MKEWTVETKSGVFYINARSYEEALDKAYERLGYDPDEIFVYCEDDEE